MAKYIIILTDHNTPPAIDSYTIEAAKYEVSDFFVHFVDQDGARVFSANSSSVKSVAVNSGAVLSTHIPV